MEIDFNDDDHVDHGPAMISDQRLDLLGCKTMSMMMSVMTKVERWLVTIAVIWMDVEKCRWWCLGWPRSSNDKWPVPWFTWMKNDFNDDVRDDHSPAMNSDQCRDMRECRTMSMTMFVMTMVQQWVVTSARIYVDEMHNVNDDVEWWLVTIAVICMDVERCLWWPRSSND